LTTYEELTELTLDELSFRQDEQGRALCDFVSSCCPRLRRLDIRSPRGLIHLVLRAEALEELWFFYALGVEALDDTAPSLLLLDQ
jgi:hypothetical protein